jgi:hypothetical protein
MARIGGHDERNRVRGRVVAQSLRSVRFLTPAEPPGGQWPSVHVGALQRKAAQAPRRYKHLTVVSGGKQASGETPYRRSHGALTDI